MHRGLPPPIVRSTLLSVALSLFFAGCTHPRALAPAPAAAPTLQGDPAHPGSTEGWVRTELYFGLGPADHPDQGVSEAQWRDFVDQEVTPRFPAGLSAANMYGQWQGKGEPEPSRLRSKVLIILYQNTAENKAKIDAIRAAWKQRTGDQSVLRVTQPADVSF
ncbi:MAG: DUF3574 domain-containing protein [Terracidiphilus sp.]